MPRKFHGQRRLAGYSLWGGKESHPAEHTCCYLKLSPRVLGPRACGHQMLADQSILSWFPGSYECGICGKKYKYYNCFQTHVRAHRGEWCVLGQSQGTWTASSTPAACIWSQLGGQPGEGAPTTPPWPPKTRSGLLPPQLPTRSLCLSPAWSGELTAACIQIWVRGRPWPPASRRQVSPFLPWPTPSTQSLENASTH